LHHAVALGLEVPFNDMFAAIPDDSIGGAAGGHQGYTLPPSVLFHRALQPVAAQPGGGDVEGEAGAAGGAAPDVANLNPEEAAFEAGSRDSTPVLTPF